MKEIMSKDNRILLEDILLNMAANVQMKYDNKYRHYRRIGDCYTHVANFIHQHYENPNIEKCDIVIYSLGGKIAHCVLKDHNNNIVADDFKNSRTFYDPKTEEIKYVDKKLGTDEMGAGYKLDHNSFRINIKDFSKLFVNQIDELIKRQKYLKENIDGGKGDYIKDFINGVDNIELKHLSVFKTELDDFLELRSANIGIDVNKNEIETFIKKNENKNNNFKKK